MKIILFLSSCLMAAQCATAQITLNAADYNTVAGTADTMKTINISSLPAITTGTNQLWDFTNVIFDSTFIQQHTAAPAGYSGTNVYTTDSVKDSIGYTYYYYDTSVTGITSDGLVNYGYAIGRQAISMQPFTMQSSDSLVFQAQDVVFSTPLRNIAFPATYGNHWSDHALATIYGNMSVLGLSYTNKPFEFHSSFQTNDTVTGWGTLKIKNATGEIISLPVLQIKTTMLRYDSTLVAGTLISENVHDYTELPKGFPYYNYEYRYYMAGEATPVVDITYVENASPQAMMLYRNFPTTGIATVTKTTEPYIYPNPARNNTFTITIPTGNADGYEVISTSGQLICRGLLQPDQKTCRVQLGRDIAAGIYYVRLMYGNKQMSTQRLVIE